MNGTRRQTGDLADMIWDVPHTLAFLSQYYELLPGDLVFTGTPSGVGAVVAGDRLDGHIDGLTPLSIVIVMSAAGDSRGPQGAAPRANAEEADTWTSPMSGVQGGRA